MSYLSRSYNNMGGVKNETINFIVEQIDAKVYA
jgi:hypothetical protein